MMQTLPNERPARTRNYGTKDDCGERKARPHGEEHVRSLAQYSAAIFGRLHPSLETMNSPLV
jgi:hypothetical protein